MKKKQGFRVDQHLETGQKLQAVDDTLIRLACEVSRAYPKSSRAAKYAEKAFKAVRSLRNELDSCLFREHRDIANGATRIYYDASPLEADYAEAKRLAENFSGEYEIGLLCHEGPEAISDAVRDAFKEHNASTIKLAYQRFKSELISQGR